MEDFPCVHRGHALRNEKCKPCKRGDTDVFLCTKHGECTILASEVRNKEGRVRSCMSCEDRVGFEDQQKLAASILTPVVARPPKEPPAEKSDNPDRKCIITNASGAQAHILKDLYREKSVFLMCSGPTLKDTDWNLLTQRGIITAAVNNAGTMFRPNIWFCVDKPGHFHEHIWNDPAVMKFARWCNRKNEIRTRVGKAIVGTGEPAYTKPNTWFYEHQTKMDVNRFLTMYPLTWGTNNKTDPTKNGKRSCMLPAIRTLYFLGFRKIYLLGCDFNMHPEATYAFDDPKTPSACKANNGTYERLNEWFGGMAPHFKEYGLQVVNCTPGGKLDAFPRTPLRDVVDELALTGELKTQGLYRGYKT